MSAPDLGSGSEYEEILGYINERITPHLKLTMRAVGEWRPVDPVEFIAGCFTSGEIPQRGEGGSNSDISLASYLEQHQVVTIMQRAVGACAAAEPAPDDPLKFVGDYIAEHRDDADNDAGQGQKEEPEAEGQEEGGEEAKAPEPEPDAEADAEPANE